MTSYEFREKVLSKTFLENGLNLTFRKLSTKQQGSSLEFLDVNHIADKDSSGGFYTSNFTKPTAVNRIFLNGNSHHPRSVYKSIIFSESIRLRRLNEKQEHYVEAIEKLQEQCLKSGFVSKLLNNMTDLTKTWTERFAPPQKSHLRNEKKEIVWSTSFPELLKLSLKERKLN